MTALPSGAPMDAELEKVAEAVSKYDPVKIARILRDTIDQLYDGQHTGRYKPDQLFKTEKTHCGTLVEINLQKKLKIADGKDMDFLIAGVEVDCKYSLGTSWMIPLEAIDHLCMLVTADDHNATWKLGLIRATEDNLSAGKNRDSKRQLPAEKRKNIRWIFELPLPPNVLLQLNHADVESLMQLPTGQKRLNQLFRIAQGIVIPGAVAATVAQQKDYMKRIRGNGGARDMLKPEGIVILGQFAQHKQFAKQLGLPIPGRGDSISARLVAVDAGENTIELEGKHWRIAKESDPIMEAPKVAHSKDDEEDE